MFGLMQLAAELDNPFRDSGFGFDKVDVFCCFLGGRLLCRRCQACWNQSEFKMCCKNRFFLIEIARWCLVMIR